MSRVSVSNLITHRCVVLVFAFLLRFLPFNFCCGCHFIWFRLFINSVISLCSFSVHILFDIKLELVNCKLRV